MSVINNKNKNNILETALTKNSWLKTNIDGLPVNQSPLLAYEEGLAHAFTTRHGGKTPAPLESFNLGRNVDSDALKLDALENRKKLCAALRLDFNKLVVPAQVHSATVVVTDKTGSFPQVDAIATQTAGLPVLLHFADCVPIIIYDRQRPALCVVHAGWKGTAAAIVRNAVKTMVSQLGSRPCDLIAAVGPAIGSCCYPTGSEVAEKLSKTVSNCEKLIIWKDSQARPDLKAINALQLLEEGVGAVDVTDLCTACHPEIFYSHRQSGGKTGRQGAIASLS